MQNLNSLSQKGYRLYKRTGLYKLSNTENDKGYFETLNDLIATYSTGFDGWFATIGETDGIYMWDSDSNQWKITYKEIDVENSIPRVNANYNPIIGVQLDKYSGTIYNTLILTGTTASTNIIIATGSTIGGGAILPIMVNGNSIILSDVNIDPKSDIASNISGETDRYVFWKDSLGIYYSITNLGVLS